jgi:hypothetical protein
MTHGRFLRDRSPSEGAYMCDQMSGSTDKVAVVLPG